MIDGLQDRTPVAETCRASDGSEHLWKVVMCDVNTPILCVDCTKTCQRCPMSNGQSYLSPCITTECAASLDASFGIIRFRVSERIMYPQFIGPLNVTSTSSSVRVEAWIDEPGILVCAPFAVNETDISAFNIKRNGMSVPVEEV